MYRTKMTAEQAIQEVATRNRTTAEEIRKQIRLAIMIGLCSSDESVKERWNEITHVGDLPTPEELIEHLTEQILKEISRPEPKQEHFLQDPPPAHCPSHAFAPLRHYPSHDGGSKG